MGTTIKPLSTPLVGELSGETSITQMPDVPCTMVKFKAVGSNAGNVYIGNDDVTKPDATTDTTTGLELDAGEDTGWILIDNLNKFYRIADNAGDELTYLALK